MAALSPDYNTLKKRFIQDMQLAGLTAGCMRAYLGAVEQMIRFYWSSPDLITEQQIQEYLLEQQRNGASKGSFQTTRFAIRFLFTQTLGKDFHLFKKK